MQQSRRPRRLGRRRRPVCRPSCRQCDGQQPAGGRGRHVQRAGAHATSVTDTAGDTFTELRPCHRPGRDGAERVERADHQQRRHTAHHHGQAVRHGGRGDRGPRVLRAYPPPAARPRSTSATAARVRPPRPATVQSGPTAMTSAGNELALGFYADSGFEDSLHAGSGYTSRANVSPDRGHRGAGRGPGADGQGHSGGFGVDRSQHGLGGGDRRPQVGAQTPPTVPGAPTGVTATAGNGSATVSWTAPAQRRRPDLQLHRDALHRHDGADAGHGEQFARDHQRLHRQPDPRDRLHVPWSAPPTRSARGANSAAQTP